MQPPVACPLRVHDCPVECIPRFLGPPEPTGEQTCGVPAFGHPGVIGELFELLERARDDGERILESAADNCLD